jgi:hypothetical protein
MARQKKDVNAPKRPLSAYIIYCQEQRESLKKKNPDMKATELTSQLGSMWKALSDEKKKNYLTKHEKERERYQREMKDYTPPQRDEEEKTSRRKSKKDTSSSRPKRAPSGYIIFCQDRRAEVKEQNPSFGPKQITSRLGELWRELDDDTKSDYTRRSRELSSKNESRREEEVEEVEEVEEKPSRRSEKPKKQRRGGKRRQQEDEEDLEDE